jgi:hypothetical protein
MVSCVDVVQERVNGGGASFYGSDEVDRLPGNMYMVVDDTSYFLAGASEITSVTGKIIGCSDGAANIDVAAQSPEILSDGSAKLEFDIQTGETDCFFAVTTLSVDGAAFDVETAISSDTSNWATDSTVEASGDNSASAVILVVNNIDDDEDGTSGYTSTSTIDATFTVITKTTGDGVTASFSSGAESGAEATNVPNFGIDASTDGSAVDSFHLARTRVVSASGATYYLLGLQLQCPADLTGSGGATFLLYARECDGVSINATKTHEVATNSAAGDLLWRFALRNRAVTSSSDSLLDLYALTADAAVWTHLNEAEDGSGPTEARNPGYTKADGTDGCATGGTNYKVCIREATSAESGGFNLGLESSDFGPNEAGDPQMTLVIELTSLTAANTARTTTSGAATTSNQDIAYMMIDIDIELRD